MRPSPNLVRHSGPAWAPSLRGENGQAAVEFALVLPVLVILIFAIVQLGIAFNNYLTLNDAVRVGARQFALGRGTADACAPAVQRVKTAAQSTLDVNKLVVTTLTPCTNLVVGSDAIIKATYPCDVKIPLIPAIPLTCSAQTTERVE